MKTTTLRRYTRENIVGVYAGGNVISSTLPAELFPTVSDGYAVYLNMICIRFVFQGARDFYGEVLTVSLGDVTSLNICDIPTNTMIYPIQTTGSRASFQVYTQPITGLDAAEEGTGRLEATFYFTIESVYP